MDDALGMVRSLPIDGALLATVRALGREARQALLYLVAPDWYGVPHPFVGVGTGLELALRELCGLGLALWDGDCSPVGYVSTPRGEQVGAALLLGAVFPCLVVGESVAALLHAWQVQVVAGWVVCVGCGAVGVCPLCVGGPLARVPVGAMVVPCAVHRMSNGR